MAEVVSMLLDQHADVKGVIHCTTYRIAKYLQENVRTNRFLAHDSSNRDEILKKHLTCKEPSVLLSPSMMEGIDLADDASRFQLLCKIPYPYLGDLVTKKRMERNKLWYPYTALKAIIQAFGRSVRNDKDHAVSYILDADWEQFYRRNTDLFPPEFISSFAK
jgi:Rad3-related DNA helicase